MGRKNCCKGVVFLIALKIFFMGIPTFAQSDMPQKQVTPLIAIIIDDIGYRFNDGLRATDLPAPVTLSIIPFTPFGKRLALIARERGKEIMLHAPMAPMATTLPIEAGGLDDSMDQEALALALKTMLDDIQGATGINNHMGSKLTQNRQSMTWLMMELKDRELFFIDSLTSTNSQAWRAALQQGLPSYRRDIFLDNQRDYAAIQVQFTRLIETAKAQGYALAIGHPYPETLDFLEQTLPKLKTLGVQLVSTQRLLQRVLPASEVEAFGSLVSR